MFLGDCTNFALLIDEISSLIFIIVTTQQISQTELESSAIPIRQMQIANTVYQVFWFQNFQLHCQIPLNFSPSFSALSCSFGQIPVNKLAGLGFLVCAGVHAVIKQPWASNTYHTEQQTGMETFTCYLKTASPTWKFFVKTQRWNGLRFIRTTLSTITEIKTTAWRVSGQSNSSSIFSWKMFFVGH